MNAVEDVERRKPFYTVGGNVLINWYRHFGEQYGGPLTI